MIGKLYLGWNMLSRKLILAAVLTMTWVHGYGYMVPIKTVVKNNSSQMINLFAQASGPTIDRHSEEPGWCYDIWPVLNLEPGKEMEVDLWIFREDQSKLKVSVLFSDDVNAISGDEAIVNYFRSETSMYVGDATFYKLDSAGLKTVHSGNLECNLTGSGNKYSAQIVVY